MEKENNSKANKAKSTSSSNSTNSKAKNAKAKNEHTDSKISDNAIKDTNKATKSNLKASQTENDVKPAEKRDDLTLASQEEKIKKNAGKDSKRKKAAVATAVVLLLIAGVTVPTAVYLSRRKVSVDISNNVDVIQEYTINIKRGTTIKDIVPQEIKGYTFVGFFKDAALTNPYKDTDKINKDTTIYAKYEANIYKVTLPTSPSFTIEGEGIVNNQVEVEYNSEYSFKLNLNAGYDESDIIVKVNGEALTPDQEGYYTITINGDMVIVVEGVEINTYEVTFYDSLEKNEIYQNQEIQYNQLCIYTGVTPTKTNTHIYKYTFIGWVNAQGEVVDLTTTRIVSDLELFANFKEEYIEYSIHKPEQVNIQNAEGIYLSNTATLHYGDIVTITYDTTQGYDVTAFEVNGAEKISGSENQYKITGNLEVIYTEEIQTFTVSIAVNNADYGTVNTSSITVDYGTAISVNGNQLTIGDTTITAIPTTDNPTYDYAFTGWTNTASEVTEAITIIANFEMTMDEYEVTIAVNEASYGTINLSTVTVNYDTPITVEDNKLTINGQEIIATPTASDAQYTYAFGNWTIDDIEVTSASKIQTDLTITANFTRDTNEYRVTIQSNNTSYGTVDVESVTVDYGTVISVNGNKITIGEYTITATPATNTAQYTYAFGGWSTGNTSVTGDLTITANFTRDTNEYRVTIQSNNTSYGTVSESSITVDYGTAISVNGNQLTIGDTTITAIPTTDNPTYDYAFTGWTNTASEVTEAITIIANFEMTMDEYEVTIAVNEASYGTINLSTVTVNYDTPITVEDNKLTINGQEIIATPTASDAQYTYEFGNWTIDDIEVTSASKIQTDLTITANFTQTVNTYTVTWLNWDGSTLETDQDVAYGTTPTYDGATPTRTDATYAYEFTGWSPAVSSVTGDVTYTAQFEQVAELLPYEINASGEITKYTGTATEVEIPSTYSLLEDGTVISGTDHTITGIAGGSYSDGAFANSSITSITLPSTIEKIGAYAFYKCTSLTSVTFGDNSQLTSIGDDAFWSCTSLTSVTIPDSVISIGDDAFWNCISLTSVTIGDGVTSIGSGAFSGSTSLESIIVDEGNAVYHSDGNCIIETESKTLIAGCKTSIIPSDGSVTSIGYEAFWNCISLTSVTIPDSVTSIGNDAFSGCTNLISITIPESVTSIGYEAFYGCSSLTSITIPDSVTSIGDSAFQHCTSLTEINFNATNMSDLSSYNYVFYNAEQDGEGITVNIGANVRRIPAYLFYDSDNITTVNFAESSQCTSIGSDAFYNCTSLTSITIPSSVTNIGNFAFLNCSSLTSITIPESVTSIGGSVFKGCRGLTSITIPSSVTTIGNGTFEDCSSLTSITIPDSVTSIGSHAFSGCRGLTSITIPSSVTSIGSEAFYICYNLANVYYGGTIDEWISISFADSSANPLSNGANLFVNGDELVTEINIDSATTIKSYIFEGCKSLTKVTIGSQVTSIGDGAFSGCTGLTSITIPSSVTIIGKATFQNCSSLTSITIPDSVTSIGSFAFSGCRGLTSITIPSSVTIIGKATFQNCSSLTSITIPENVTSIGTSAFYRCTGLTSITIPSSVTSIGSRAFYGCTNLTSVTIESNYAYANATSTSACGYLLQNATEVRVLTSCIGTDTNRYLENTSNFTKTTSEDGLYYIYTKV